MSLQRNSKHHSRSNSRGERHLGASPERRLYLEALEDRRLLAVFSVSNLNDAGGGSLRDAINMANAAGGADEIVFSVNGTIALASQLPTIADDLTITGPGQDLITLDAGGGTDPNTAGDGHRLFNIDDGNNGHQIDVEISGLTLTGGDVSTGDLGGHGGAVRNYEKLTITSSILSGNMACGGGGIVNYGTVTVSSSTISGNTACGGGGIFNYGTATVTSSTISGNTASYSGGGIGNGLGTLTVAGSTISGNTASGGVFSSSGGGGIFNHSGMFTVTSSTLSGNTAANKGGGIDNFYGTATVASSTLSGNTARYDSGGGIFNFGTATVTSSVVAGNIARTDANVAGVLSTNTFNLIDVAPLLGPLADNGGPTWTHALLPGSPAIEAGNPAVQHDPNEFDQRGAPYYRVADGDVPRDIVIDIGAYEAQRPPSADFDENNVVNGRDALLWQRGYGTTVSATRSDGNSDDDQDVDASDRAAWEVSFGQGLELPEEILSDADLLSRPTRAELVDAALAYVMAEAGVAEDEPVLFEERLIEYARPLGVQLIHPARVSLVESLRVVRSNLQTMGADDLEIDEQVSGFWQRGETS